ncbi:hypothetical protein [Celeribacter neptunius]|uniref:Uncharacterized protein n=1 Tax=Celeribacter neptunius TaxID=588602 RepID=A0A1I3WW22_9RHOB|nr:hypothetical protein [Celeribacter neptunius]SFK11369.1 hypothetical protein SAMN04487991_3863 [Celeribacter neptunius]
MTDYIAKARQGRTIALSQSQSGSVMFFPEEFEDVAAQDRRSSRRTINEMSKPMFVRSSSVRAGTMARAMIDAPNVEEAANTPLILTAEDAIENVMRLAA